jgi:hypothetical protein
LPRREPGQGPAIPRRRAEQPVGAAAVQAAGAAVLAGSAPVLAGGAPVLAGSAVQAGGETAVAVAAPPAGLIAGEGELLRLADSEEAWW